MARRRYQHGCVFKKGKVWVLRYREDVLIAEGSTARVHRSVVLGSLRTRREAEQAADTYTRKINDSTRPPLAAITLRDFWEKYFEPEILPTLKYSTCQLYRFLSGKHLLPALGGQKLCEVARFQVQQFIGNKQRQGYSPQTLRHFRNLLGKMFGTAQRWGWMESNPAHLIDLPPMARRVPKHVLTPEQLSGLSSTLVEPVRTILLLGALTGLRIGELLALEVNDVDFTRGMVSVRRDVYRGRIGTPKTPGSERQIPLATPLIPLLNDWLAIRPSGSPWLFPSATGTPLLDRNLMRRHLWPACEKIGIPRFGWHSLRHTFNTYNGNAGVAMPVLQSLLGHSSPETTMVYTHPLEDAKRQAVEHLARILFPNAPLNEGSVVKGFTLLN